MRATTSWSNTLRATVALVPYSKSSFRVNGRPTAPAPPWPTVPGHAGRARLAAFDSKDLASSIAEPCERGGAAGPSLAPRALLGAPPQDALRVDPRGAPRRGAHARRPVSPPPGGRARVRRIGGAPRAPLHPRRAEVRARRRFGRHVAPRPPPRAQGRGASMRSSLRSPPPPRSSPLTRASAGSTSTRRCAPSAGARRPPACRS
jgi:hypothetical protein